MLSQSFSSTKILHRASQIFQKMALDENIKPSERFLKKFPFTPTFGQAKLFTLMDDFILDEERFRDTFILKGYAGTGKTTFVSTLIKVLKEFGYKAVLLAPTGRAAKVMSGYSKRMALTIHKKIYRQVENAYTGALVFERMKNTQEGTVYIVDEASMISDEREFGTNSLLHDLLDFVFEQETNKLILIGDEAQLPPVGMIVSPALSAEHLQNRYHATITEHVLTEVMRQGEGSGILTNATDLRKQLTEEEPNIQLVTSKYKDFYRMTGDRLEDGIRYAYDKYGRENTTIITRSNKNAVQYNRFIRTAINYSENELDSGDMLMVVRNNYTVLGEESKAGFIANGDFVEVIKIRREEEMHGLRFANVTLKLVDYPDEPEFDTKIILNTLYSNAPTLSSEENKLLYESVVKDYFWVKSKKERQDLLRKDSYLNALQVKFAYALTCHKSQGGQWDAVFVDQGYLPDAQIDSDFIRWLYTAITRGVKEVFLLNFNKQFLENKD
ncbi:ATP-dependent RecD-like DNA helicase [Emticicia aquatica]|uniref:ATP-dependent RecD-like DNA helicase n=2 Tax=Emticicia aquatica TaxID=1681835 RepID=A0ABM9AK32_9BACT|nr:ATP-dependent RecD-like DNA helicase [Emticicia aquatica]